jgi:hypothetical protein
MKQTEEMLAKTFNVDVDEAKQLIELKFITKDVGKENVDVQSDLIFQAILDVYKKFPDEKNWKVLVDVATTKVSSMTKYSMTNFENLIKEDGSQKIAILMDDTDKQSAVATFALNVFSRTQKKVSVFTSRSEADMWLNS